MKLSIVHTLRCATCASEKLRVETISPTEAPATSHGEVHTGFVHCENHHWFPIEDGVLEFLPPELAYTEDRARFWAENSERLAALGLQPDTGPNNSVGTRTSTISPSVQSEVLHQQKHFDWYAENDAQSYDSYSQMPFWEAVDRATFTRWNQAVRPTDLVLDVGCAQGRASIQLAEKAPAIIGIDISKKLIRKAYANFDAAQYRGERDFIVADGSNPPFRSSVFNCVLIYGVLHHLPNPGATCSEVARILKDDGILLSSENNQSAFRAIFDYLMKISTLWHEEAGAQPLLSKSDILRWFTSTGVSVKTSTIVFLPPHLINLLPRFLGRLALKLTDLVCNQIPFLGNQGGLILIEGKKSSRAAV